jgi:Bacterial regulatory proteins, luxR family
MKCSIIHHVGHSHADADHRHKVPLPHDLSSSDPEVLRAVGRREFNERQRAECLANMQADVVKLALELLVREPDIKSFFGGLTRNMVEGTVNSHLGHLFEKLGARSRTEAIKVATRGSVRLE